MTEFLTAEGLVTKLVPTCCPGNEIHENNCPNRRAVIQFEDQIRENQRSAVCSFCKKTGTQVVWYRGYNPGCGHYECEPPCYQEERKEVLMTAPTTSPKMGQAIKYVDEVGVEHDALVTAVWSPTCINLVVVDLQEGQTDSYGQKIKRETSQVHKSLQTAPGRYWF